MLFGVQFSTEIQRCNVNTAPLKRANQVRDRRMRLKAESLARHRGCISWTSSGGGTRHSQVGQTNGFLHSALQEVTNQPRPGDKLVLLTAGHCLLGPEKQAPPLHWCHRRSRQKRHREIQRIRQLASTRYVNSRRQTVL